MNCGLARADRRTAPAVFCGLGMKILEFSPRPQDRGLCGCGVDFARSGPDRVRSHHWFRREAGPRLVNEIQNDGPWALSKIRSFSNFCSSHWKISLVVIFPILKIRGDPSLTAFRDQN